MPILRTERLVLRPIAPADVDALHRFWTDPGVRKYLWDNEIISQEQVREIISESERCFAEIGCGLYAIELAERGDDLVGFCGLRRMCLNAAAEAASEAEADDVELLYGILPRYWGEGLVTEAAREVLRHGINDCGLKRILGATDTPNQRSVRVMQRLGMIFEERRNHKGLDTVVYSVSPKELASAQ
jgi:[ribosomal protein S5]-alanine N-acetyltransferase